MSFFSAMFLIAKTYILNIFPRNEALLPELTFLFIQHHYLSQELGS